MRSLRVGPGRQAVHDIDRRVGRLLIPRCLAAAPAASNPVGKVVTPLEKLLVLRKALISLGVPGAEFDRARDIIKTEHESKGAEVWQIVCEKLSEHFVDALQKV